MGEQFFRGVLGGRSRGVFNGRALIREGADGSSVRQSNANLLLSPLAEMDTKPDLEIYADEVEASHGATVGQLDETAVFYLRTRGLPEAEARRLLTSAFCQGATSRVGDAALAETVAQMKRLVDDGEMKEINGKASAYTADANGITGITVDTAEGPVEVACDTLLVFWGLAPKLGPIAEWGLDINRKTINVDTERFETSTPGIYAVGDINYYPGKKKLILCGFHEAALAAFATLFTLLHLH